MTAVEGDAGNLIAGGTFNAPVNQYMNPVVGRQRRARLLLPENVARITDSFVKTVSFDIAATVLERDGAVVLTGERGSGRYTTAIALLDGKGVLGQIVNDDMSETQQIEPGHAYLVDLEDSHTRLGEDTVFWLGDILVRARRAGCPVVVRVGEDWSRLGSVRSGPVPVTVAAPEPGAAFVGHLRVLARSQVVKEWAEIPQIAERLAASTVADATRLAQLTSKVCLLDLPIEKQIEQVLAADAKWSDELHQWFKGTASENPSDGYLRALKLTVAAVGPAPAQVVFTGEELLARLVALPPRPGHPLIGASVKDLAPRVKAVVEQDGTIGFTRPDYAEAVFDHIWETQPQMRSVVQEWLIELAQQSDPHHAAAAALTGIAVRQADADLACTAAKAWARAGNVRTRRLAVDTLTVTAVDPGTGRRTRQQLYDWAASGGPPEEVHLVVAEVCAGLLADVYPQNALTRLRNLVVRSDRVAGFATQALAELSKPNRIRGAVLGELTNWLHGSELRRTRVMPTFLSLAAMREEDGGITLLQGAAPVELNRLAELWRHVLRESGPSDEVLTTVGDWLESTMRDGSAAPEVFVRACWSFIDLGHVTKAVLRWSKTPGATAPDRDDVALRLLDAAQARLAGPGNRERT